MHNFQRGGPRLNFAYFFMQFYNTGDPKGETMAQCPLPLNTPLHVRNFYQNRPKTKLLVQKNCKITKRWRLHPQPPKTASHCRFLATPLIIGLLFFFLYEQFCTNTKLIFVQKLRIKLIKIMQNLITE